MDEIPWAWRPAFHAFGYGVGGGFELALRVTRRSCRFEGLRHDRAAEPPRIECIWHEHLPAYIAAFLPGPHPHVWLNHPSWYMRPVHVLLGLRGVREIMLGSSGHGGKQAAARVAERLAAGGLSTGVAVDGPAGPPRELKPGALDMAAATGLPIVPIRFEYERAARGRGWDRKHWPLPGSTVRVVEGSPIHVSPTAPRAHTQLLQESLG